MTDAPNFEGLDTSVPIAVTGASGYIASWVVKYLLEAGATVHATVRDPSRKDKVGHLEALAEGTPGKLVSFAADLMKEGSFDAAIAGCKIVMHTASPFFLQGIKDAEAQLVRPAKEGTANVLGAVARSGSVERVVLTSSVAAIYGDNVDCAETEKGIFTEAHWNRSSSASHNPYSYSKTVAEREAWRLHDAQADGEADGPTWSLATINPSFVMGPPLSGRTDSTSGDTIKRFVDGRFFFGAPKLIFGQVDVREVAAAHILAAIRTELTGRFILSSQVVTMQEIAASLRRSFGTRYPLPRTVVPKAVLYLGGPFMGFGWKFIKNNVGVPMAFDNSRSRELLGVRYRPLDETLKDHVDAMRELGMIKK